MEFYNLKLKKKVSVPEDKIEYRQAKNGRWMAVAVVDGLKMSRFVKKDDVKKPESKKTMEKNQKKKRVMKKKKEHALE